ncbi:MAG TPA: YajQ family cyclic di-GMP-binding protein [Spirochaetia bacterium]|nr:YajQ family cyclic di-GMP-binding protein [Spirochaetia bacterium]
MAKENTFDVVSRVEMQEVDNAVNQATREMTTRFDFKGSKSSIVLNEDNLVITGDDDFKLKSVREILEQKLVKRGISVKALVYGKPEKAAGDTIRQKVDLIQGIDRDKAREMTKMVKDSKIKAQVTVQEDQLRVSAKNRDDLQAVIKLLQDHDFGLPLQFVNYRTF